MYNDDQSGKREVPYNQEKNNVSLFTFPVLGSNRNSGLGLWESLDFEIERHQFNLKSSLEFEIICLE